MPPGLKLSRSNLSRFDLSQCDAALFDVDGTLIDSVGVIVRGLSDTLEHYFDRRPAQSEARALVGMPLRTQLAIYKGSAVTDVELSEMTSFAISRFNFYQSQEIEFESAVQTLRFLHQRGLKTALVTSKNQCEIDVFLPRFAARDSVDTVVCASDVLFPKPSPESAILACKRLGVSPDRTVMIGDSIFDMRCARDAGVFQVAVAYGAAPRAELEAEFPDLLIDQPEDLLAWAHQALLIHHAP